MDNLSFLIVEDDPYFARNLKNRIFGLGHDVTNVAGTMTEAIVSFNKQRPDIIIMDIELADHDTGGIELAATFQQMGDIPIIFYTNYIGRKDYIQKAICTRPVAILSKTFETEDLEANIENVIQQYIGKDKKSFTIWSEKKYRQILFSDLCWIHTQKGKIYFSVENIKEEIEFSMGLKDFTRKIWDESFLWISQSYIVNVYKITTLDPESKEVYISCDGAEHPLVYSAKHLKGIKAKMNFVKTR